VLSEYPAWEISYWGAWMRRVPTGQERVEWQLACFRSQWMSAHVKKGAEVPKPQELLLPDWFQTQKDIQQRKAAKRDIDTILGQFMSVGVGSEYRKAEATENDYIGN
jgi:hypothetical protein